MSIETDVSKSERHEREPLPIVSYEKYREICDAAQPEMYRVTGITSAEHYEVSLADERTKYAEIGGERLPLIAPIEHAGGYNAEGCHELTGSKEVYILALPPRFLEITGVDAKSLLAACDNDTSIVVETSSEYTAEFKEMMSVELAGEWRVGEFIDPRCLKDHQTAQMSVYMAHFDSVDNNGAGLPYRDLSYDELFEEEVREKGPSDTEFVSAARVRENPELFEQLWNLHDDRFDWLGKYHPISMQESKAFFQDILSDDDTKSYVRFDTNENGDRVPVCHGCSLDGLDHVDWLNATFREKLLQDSMEVGENVEFFYGIVSKSTLGQQVRYAKDVMGLNSRLVRRNGERLSIIFESTNLSSIYIPNLVKEYIGGEPNGVKMVGGVEKIASMDYWFLKSGANETV